MANWKFWILGSAYALLAACNSTSSDDQDDNGLAEQSSSSLSATVSSSSVKGNVIQSSSSSVLAVSSSSFDWSSFCWPGTACAGSSSSATPTSSSTPATSSSSAATTVSSSSARTDGELVGNQMWDHRDNQLYNIVTLGTAVWTVAMSYATASGSSCYENSVLTDADANCEKFGRLYTYAAAQTVCPVGWHLPSQAEVSAASDDLTLAYGGRMKDNAYAMADSIGFMWVAGSSTSADVDNCTASTTAECGLVYVEKNGTVADFAGVILKFTQLDWRTKGFSVRCVQD